MSDTTTVTCINCPLGCTVTIRPESNLIKFSGNECRRGEDYAMQEYRDPRRSLTGTVKAVGGFLPRLPVKTDGTLQKNLITTASRALDHIMVQAPVKCGDIIVRNFLESGVNLVATRTLEVGD